MGEAPGEAEERFGEPFIGGSGTLLRGMLSRTGMPSLEQMFVTNICHTRPPGNDFIWFLKPDNMPKLASGLMQLKKDIEEIKPNLILALGSYPLRFLTGKQGIDKWRGSILESTLVPGVKVIGTYHPAYILRVYDYKAVAEFDLVRAREEMLFPEIIRPNREFFLNPDEDTALAIANSMLSSSWLSIDIECYYKEDSGWALSCVGFSDRANRAMVLPWSNATNRNIIKTLCECPIPKVMQNGTFDSTVLATYGINIANFAWDTMIAHHELYAECAGGGDEMSALAGKKRQSAIAKGLGFQTSIYTKEPFYKDDGKLWTETNDLKQFWTYNARDAAVTREIRDVQEVELKDFGTYDSFLASMQLVAPLMSATAAGILIDPKVRATLQAKYEGEVDNLQRFLDAQAGRPINVKSSKDVPDLLYNILKLPPQRKRGTDRTTADKDAIHTLAGKHNHPALHTILAIRERRDLLERYIQAPIDADGRIRCSFDITGTRSGRLASRKSIYGSGTNLQTIPEELRCMFIPSPGKVFIYRDYSQAEARVVAYLARCEGLIELFSDPNRDIHKENAARIFGKPVAEVTKTERYLAKRVVHASNYGMEAKRLVEIVNQDAILTGVRITEHEAADLLTRYFAIYPEIKEVFWSDVRNNIQRTRTLSNPFGRKRTFYGRYDDKLVRDAYSWIPQSTIGDLGRRAVVAIHNNIPECQLLMNVHDSILVECLPQDVGLVTRQMATLMEIPITIHGRKFLVPTDCKVGYNWGNAHSENPNGLSDYEDN